MKSLYRDAIYHSFNARARRPARRDPKSSDGSEAGRRVDASRARGARELATRAARDPGYALGTIAPMTLPLSVPPSANAKFKQPIKRR